MQKHHKDTKIIAIDSSANEATIHGNRIRPSRYYELGHNAPKISGLSASDFSITPYIKCMQLACVISKISQVHKTDKDIF